MLDERFVQRASPGEKNPVSRDWERRLQPQVADTSWRDCVEELLLAVDISVNSHHAAAKLIGEVGDRKGLQAPPIREGQRSLHDLLACQRAARPALEVRLDTPTH